tara:strand:+ start:441 stop:911 length:471 start_codon:yes stop_codon:yes gene_type:complete
MKKNIYKFIKILLIFNFMISCTKPNTRMFKEPIYNVPESEYEGYFIDYFTDFIIEQYYTLDSESSLLHASAIFSALNDKKHGEVYYWENNNFFGKVRIVLTYFLDQDIVCRHWIEQVGKNKQNNLNGILTYKYKDKTNIACYDFKKKKWEFTNYNI